MYFVIFVIVNSFLTLVITLYTNSLFTCLQATIREAHEEAVQKAVAAFNATAVGAGSVRQKCEKRLHTFLRKEFEVVSQAKFLLPYYVLGETRS